MSDETTTHQHQWTGLAASLPVVIVRRLAEATLALIMASYAVIICTQVFYRFALNQSLTWSEELVRYGLLWGVMIGAGVASDRGAHVALDPLRGLLKSRRAQAIVTWIVGLLVIIFCAIVAYASWQYIGRLWMMTSPAIRLPMRYVFAAIPAGCLLMIFFVFVHLVSGTYTFNKGDELESAQ